MMGLCWGQVRPSRAMLGLWQTAQPDFVSKTLFLPGTGITKMPPEQVYFGLSWGYVGPSGVYVGAKFAHLEQCWGYRKRHSLILSPKPCSCLGRALQKCPLNRSMLAYLGAMLAHLGSMLGPCSPILGLYVGALLTLRR